MAAGLGTRINELIQGIPKCTVQLGQITLIENTIRELKRMNITEIGIVTGYKAHLLRDIVKHENITFFHNPFFDKTNSIVSMWFARNFIWDDSDYLFLNADVYFESRILQEILQEQLTPVMFADRERKAVGDYKFIYKEGQLLEHGKHISPDESSGEYIGIAKVSREFLPRFKDRLDLLIYQRKHHYWWENVLYSFMGETDIFVREISHGLFWGEVDTIDDYRRILAFTNQAAKL